MPRRALIQKRPWLFAAICAAIVFYVYDGGELGGLWLALIKGGAVMCLAIYAIVRAGKTQDGWTLGCVFAFGAMGDFAIEFSTEIGGALFLAAHIVAVIFYHRNRAPDPCRHERVMAAVLFVLAPLVLWLLTCEVLVALYGIGLGAMVHGAWLSRFSRRHVRYGAVLFLVSDWLIFAAPQFERGGFDPHIGVWPLYFTGQFLIATGIVPHLAAARHKLIR